MRLTYVIGYRHSYDRIINLRRVLDWLSGFNNIEVVIVEQDKYSKISHLNLKASHIFIKSDRPYNRSWAFNVALKRCMNPIIVFGDSDLVMDPHQFLLSVNELNNFEVVSPYSSVLDLTIEENNYPFEMLSTIQRPGRGETDNQKINLCGGIVIFRTESALKLSGFCESFEGWGGEDDFQTYKVDKLGVTNKIMPFKCFHFWHQRDQTDMSGYQRTIQMLSQLTLLDEKQLQLHINATAGKIGMLNKYA
jgi:predicted glycosyltransferase involved in capsule biosynthesis